MSSPLVSICIPVFDGGDYLAAAIDSALAQTYPNIEYIISDDGSSDGSIAGAIATLRAAGCRFKYTNHQRSSAPANWNHCASAASGEYVKFLFQDDLLEPTCVERLLTVALEDSEIGLVFSKRRVVVSAEPNNAEPLERIASKIVDLHDRWTYPLQPVQSGRSLLSDPQLLKGLNKIGEPSTVLLSRQVFDTVGYFDPNCCQLADVDFWFRILAEFKVAFVPDVLSTFRVHRAQLTVRNREMNRHLADRSRLLRTLSTKKLYGHLHPQVRRSLRRWSSRASAATRAERQEHVKFPHDT